MSCVGQIDVDRDPAWADWRDPAAYTALHGCGRPVFAWEWLRRSPAYRAACHMYDNAALRSCDAAHFGLHRFEAPGLGFLEARPIWRADADPFVLIADAGGGDDVFDIARFGTLATCHIDKSGEHWLLSDGYRHLRLDIVRGTLRNRPVHLNFHVQGLTHLIPAISSLTRLVALDRTGRLVPALFPAERRAHRWALVMRTYDALVSGASQRSIAEVLFNLDVLPRWRIEAPSYRRRVQRLVAAARQWAKTDPRFWLIGGAH